MLSRMNNILTKKSPISSSLPYHYNESSPWARKGKTLDSDGFSLSYNGEVIYVKYGAECLALDDELIRAIRTGVPTMSEMPWTGRKSVENKLIDFIAQKFENVEEVDSVSIERAESSAKFTVYVKMPKYNAELMKRFIAIEMEADRLMLDKGYSLDYLYAPLTI